MDRIDKQHDTTLCSKEISISKLYRENPEIAELISIFGKRARNKAIFQDEQLDTPYKNRFFELLTKYQDRIIIAPSLPIQKSDSKVEGDLIYGYTIHMYHIDDPRITKLSPYFYTSCHFLETYSVCGTKSFSTELNVLKSKQSIKDWMLIDIPYRYLGVSLFTQFPELRFVEINLYLLNQAINKILG